MKIKYIFLLITLVFTTFSANAQRGLKIAYVDMDYILENMPEYQEASRQLDTRVQKWRGEIEADMKEVEDMKQNLENERALLTKELIEEREEEIDYEEQQIQEYQQKKFGPQGDFMIQKRQLIQPIQDQIFNAVQEVGATREYDFIFENSAEALLLYSAKRHDISDRILTMIQRSSKKIERENRTTEKEKEGEEKEEDPIENYKSVEDARKDKEEQTQRDEERQEKIDERETQMNDRQQKRDSARAARQKEYEQRRAKMIEEREAKRDSIQKAREEQRKDR